MSDDAKLEPVFSPPLAVLLGQAEKAKAAL